MGLLDNLVSNTMQSLTSFNFQTLTETYNKRMLLLNDTVSVVANSFGINISNYWDVPLPLIGFVFNYAGDIPFIKNEHSEYPYLDKQLLIEGAIRQPADFSLTLHKLITSLSPFNVITLENQLFINAIDYYDRKGGTFAVITPWGTIDYCVLTGLYGIQSETENGLSYRIDLKKLVPVSTQLDNLINDAKRMAMGVVGKTGSYLTV